MVSRAHVDFCKGIATSDLQAPLITCSREPPSRQPLDRRARLALSATDFDPNIHEHPLLGCHMARNYGAHNRLL